MSFSLPSLVLHVLAYTTARTLAQSIRGLGISGGNGSKGGIGDIDHPVLRAQSFITDALIPTQPNTTRQLARGPPPLLHASNASNISPGCAAPRNVIIDSSSNGARQEMLGYGHSWTDSAVSVFESLEPELLDQVMEELFGESGNNMGFMRHTIGASDLSGEFYSYDDNGPSFNQGEPDPTLASFGLGTYGSAMARMIARMGQYKGDVFLFGAPWSYPGWMKNNDLFIGPNVITDGNQYPLLNNSLNIEYIPSVIEYFTRYIDAFKEYGVSINGLSLQNEPLNPQGGYPTMYLDAADEAQILLQGLGGTLHERGAIFMAYDHNTDQPVYPYRVKQGAKDLVDSVAWHCYQGPVANYTVLEDFNRTWPGILQFMTECTNYLPSGVNFQVAQSFMPPVQHGASGAAMWVMATDPDFGPHSPYGGCDGCLGSIIVNSSTLYTKTNDYYMVGQFSRFVRRGAVMHQILQGAEGSALTSAQFYINAFLNPDGSWAVIFMNNYGSDQYVVLSLSEVTGEYWEGTVPSATVVTWLIPSEENRQPSNGTYTPSAGPPYAYPNSTLPYGSASVYSSGTGSASVSACNVTATTSSSSTSTSSATVIPVPDTTHTIATDIAAASAVSASSSTLSTPGLGFS